MATNFLKIQNGIGMKPLSAVPIDPVKGDLYYDNALNSILLYNGTDWVDMGANALLLDGSTSMVGDIIFEEGMNRAISVLQSAAGVGNNLSTSAGTAGGAGSLGGTLFLRAGQTTEGYSGPNWQAGASIDFQSSAATWPPPVASTSLNAYRTYMRVIPTIANRCDFIFGPTNASHQHFYLGTSASDGFMYLEARGNANHGDFRVKAMNRTAAATFGTNLQLLGGTGPSGKGQVILDGREINANSTKIINVADPTLNQDAATKKYVDDNAKAAFTGTVVSARRASDPSGWLKMDGRTIGNGASGATGRANADAQDLFLLLWDESTNTQLPIQDSAGAPTTRGASAAIDFAANKRMPLDNGAALSIQMPGTQAINGRNKSGPVLGDKQEDQMQGHFHYAISGVEIFETTGSADAGYSPDMSPTSSVGDVVAGNAFTDGVNGTPRVGAETRMNTLGLNFFIKL